MHLDTCFMRLASGSIWFAWAKPTAAAVRSSTEIVEGTFMHVVRASATLSIAPTLSLRSAMSGRERKGRTEVRAASEDSSSCQS